MIEAVSQIPTKTIATMLPQMLKSGRFAILSKNQTNSYVFPLFRRKPTQNRGKSVLSPLETIKTAYN